MQELKSIAAGLCLGISAIGIAAGSAHPAQATIMVEDLSEVSGLDTFITRDTVSGLDWLDVNLTTSISYNGITGGSVISNSGALNGLNPITGFANPFRHATALEISGLFTNAGIPDINVGWTGPNFSPANALKALLGPTGEIGTLIEFTQGVSADDSGSSLLSPSHRVPFLQECSSAGPNCTAALSVTGPFFLAQAVPLGGSWLDTMSDITIGHFLVRTPQVVSVPEPPTWTLLVFGLMALAGLRLRGKTA